MFNLRANRSNHVKIGLFIDGGYLSAVSNYYRYQHYRAERIDIAGLREFVRSYVANSSHMELNQVQVVSTDHFRGRRAGSPPDEARAARDHQEENALIREGVRIHIQPMGSNGEKGVDVDLALHAQRMALFGQIDVCALVTGDGDFVPLARELKTLGLSVLVLGWEFKYAEGSGRPGTNTSQALLREATHAIMVSSWIDDKSKQDEVAKLFRKPTPVPPAQLTVPTVESSRAPWPQVTRVARMEAGRLTGKVNRITNTFAQKYGFLTPSSGAGGIFFGENDVEDGLASICVGDWVTYEIGSNRRGPCARNVKKLVDKAA